MACAAHINRLDADSMLYNGQARHVTCIGFQYCPLVVYAELKAVLVHCSCIVNLRYLQVTQGTMPITSAELAVAPNAGNLANYPQAQSQMHYRPLLKHSQPKCAQDSLAMPALPTCTTCSMPLSTCCLVDILSVTGSLSPLADSR